MIAWASRFREVETKAACPKCSTEFVVVTASLLMKTFPWTKGVRFCPYCGTSVDWAAIDAGTTITES